MPNEAAIARRVARPACSATAGKSVKLGKTLRTFVNTCRRAGSASRLLMLTQHKRRDHRGWDNGELSGGIEVLRHRSVLRSVTNSSQPQLIAHLRGRRNDAIASKNSINSIQTREEIKQEERRTQNGKKGTLAAIPNRCFKVHEST